MVVYVPETKKVLVTYGSKYLPSTPVSCSPGDGVFVVDDNGSDGLEWGTPANISAQLGEVTKAGGVIPGPGAGIVLSIKYPGRIIFSGSIGAYNNTVVYYSDDAGKSWKASTTYLPLMDESTVVELPDGSIYINMRNNNVCKCRAYSISLDGGTTFSLPVSYDKTLVDPTCEGALTSFGDNRIYFSNPASQSQRANITIRRSQPINPGELPVWEEEDIIVGPGSTWGGYSTMVSLPVVAGQGGILFERNDSSTDVISFTLFPLEF